MQIVGPFFGLYPSGAALKHPRVNLLEWCKFWLNLAVFGLVLAGSPIEVDRSRPGTLTIVARMV